MYTRDRDSALTDADPLIYLKSKSEEYCNKSISLPVLNPLPEIIKIILESLYKIVC